MRQKAKILLSIFQISSSEEQLRNLISQSITDTNMLQAFQTIVPYKIGISTKEYLNQMMLVINQHDHASIEIITILLDWFKEYTQEMSLKKVNHLNQLRADFSDEKIWLYCLLEGKLNEYNAIHNHSIVTVEKTSLEEIKEENKKLTEQVHRLQRHTQHEAIEKQQLEKLKMLEQEDDFYQFLSKQNPEYLTRKQLYGKRIAFFVEKIFDEQQINEVMEEFGLRDFKVYSSINIPKQIGIFDYILFSTTRASHSTLYKLRTLTKAEIISTTSVNLHTAMDDLKRLLIGQRNT